MTHCAFLLSCFSLNLRSRHSCGIIQLLMSYLTGCLFFFNSYHSPWLLQWPILWAASVFIASVFFRIRFPPISGGLGAQGATINSQQSEITSAHWFAAWLHQCDLPKICPCVGGYLQMPQRSPICPPDGRPGLGHLRYCVWKQVFHTSGCSGSF